MPVDPELKSQLASLRYSYRDGLLLIEDKEGIQEAHGALARPG
jgi:hypothetical protein